MRGVVHINLEDVLILLEDGPHSLGQLAAWMQVSVPTMRSALVRLAKEGRARRVGAQKHWALVGTLEAAAPATSNVPPSRGDGPREPAVPVFEDEPVTIVDEIDDEDEADLVDELLQAPPRRAGRPKALRQAAAPTSGTSSGPAWWVGLDREALNARASTSAAAMSASREARSISGVRGISR